LPKNDEKKTKKWRKVNSWRNAASILPSCTCCLLNELDLKIWKFEKKKYFGKIWHRDLFGKGTVPVLVEYLSEILWKRKCEKTTMFGTSRCLKNVYVWMCPICIFVSVETFLSLNMCQYDQSYNSLKSSQKFQD